jgi:transposase-like protein
MKQESKLNLKLKEGETVKHPNTYFSESDKRSIVEEYLNTDVSKSGIWEKYVGHKRECGKILDWMNEFGYVDKPSLTNRNRFSTEQKHRMIQDYLSTGRSRRAIWQKYTGSRKENGIMRDWMRKLGYEDKNIQRNTTFAENISAMKKEKSSDSLSPHTKALEDKIKRLEKELEEAQIKAVAYSTLIDIAEQELNIPIRKKLNTKPLKK